MKQNIIERNKLIAEFIGHKNEHNEYEIPISSTDDTLLPYWEDELQFNSEWNWLMPVLKKICRLRIVDGKEFVDFAHPRTFGMISEETGEIMVRLNGFQLQKSDTLIGATYDSVVDFIEWYNKQDHAQA